MCVKRAYRACGGQVLFGVPLICGIIALSGPAAAQDAEMLPDVADRYHGVGAHAGSFWLMPALESGIFFDSNVAARRSNQKGDWGGYVKPQIEVQSDWGRHGLKADLEITHFQYLESESQSRTTFDGAVEGQADLAHDLVLLAGVKGGLFDEQAGSLNTNGLAAEPTRHEELEAWTSLDKTFNRLSLSMGGSYRVLDYQGVDSLLGGEIDQDFRDGEIFETGSRVSYSVSPGARVFGDVRYNWRQRRGGSADSRGWRGLAGMEFGLSRLLRGGVGVGYMAQSYAGGASASGISYHAGLAWNPTPLLTVKLDAGRTIADSPVAASSGLIADNVRLSADYELKRGLVLSPSVALSHVDYSDIDRQGLSSDFGLGLDYSLNRFWSAGLSYVYTRSDIDGAAPGANHFDRHVAGAYVKARF